MTFAEYVSRWSHLHGGVPADARGLVRGWLRLSYSLAHPLQRLGVTAAAVTVAGAVLAWVAAGAALGGDAWLLVAALLVGVSALCDGLDGAVAVLSGTTSRRGALLDSLGDRASDAAYVVALWLAGAPAGVAVGAGAALAVLEYLRARSTSLGMQGVGVVTVGERPVRVAISGTFLLAAGVAATVAAGLGSPETWATSGAWATLVVSAAGAVQLLVVVWRRLA